MSGEQLAFDLAPKPAIAGVSDRMIELVSVLSHGQWMTRRELERLGFNERELRSLVEETKPPLILSFPGSPGYKLLSLATVDEVRRGADGPLRSQGRVMLRRAAAYSVYLRRVLKA